MASFLHPKPESLEELLAGFQKPEWRYHWMRPPNWRWCEILRYRDLAARVPIERIFVMCTDPVLRDFLMYVMQRPQFSYSLEREFPQISPWWGAYDEALSIFHQNNHVAGMRWQLEAMLMAKDATYEDINIEMGGFFKHGAQTVQAFAEIFFDVKQHLNNPHRLLNSIYAERRRNGRQPDDCDLTWKLIAYRFGIEKFSQFLGSYSGDPLDVEISTWLRQNAGDKMIYYSAELVDLIVNSAPTGFEYSPGQLLESIQRLQEKDSLAGGAGGDGDMLPHMAAVADVYEMTLLSSESKMSERETRRLPASATPTREQYESSKKQKAKPQ